MAEEYEKNRVRKTKSGGGLMKKREKIAIAATATFQRTQTADIIFTIIIVLLPLFYFLC